jgi:hypothetical protein
VDQRAALVAGVRRLLVRMALVVGGVFAVTAMGWLLSGTAAHADELPSVPPVSALLDHAGQQLSTPDIKPVVGAAGLTKTLDRALPDKAALAKTTGLDHTLDKTGLAKALPPTPAIDTVTKQVVPDQPRTTSVPVVHDDATGRDAAQVTRSVAIVPTYQQSRSVPVLPAPMPAPVPVRPAPAGHHHSPVLPPVQPVGSSDSTMHGTGGLAGGAGGASLPATPVLGGGLQSAGTPSTPRLAVAPGLQPGTSPD